MSFMDILFVINRIMSLTALKLNATGKHGSAGATAATPVAVMGSRFATGSVVAQK